MAVLDPLHPLQSSILDILGSEQTLNMAQLHDRLQERDISVSMPNLYRTVGQLTDMQVLVKIHGKISLNDTWIAHLTEFTERVNATYHEQQAGVFQFTLKEGERREFFADSLKGLDPIWSHVLVGMTDDQQKHPIYMYNAHPWYSIGMRDTEARFYHSMTANGNTCVMFYGNDTFLDRYGDKLIRVKNMRSYIVPSVPFPKEGYALWVFDDNILECIFPPAISRHFEFFFNTVKSIGEFDAELFSDLFRMKAKCKITVRRDKKEAEKLRAIIEKHLPAQ